MTPEGPLAANGQNLIKPKVYQKTYQSGFLFHNYDYNSDIYKTLMAEREGFEPSIRGYREPTLFTTELNL